MKHTGKRWLCVRRNIDKLRNMYSNIAKETYQTKDKKPFLAS